MTVREYIGARYIPLFIGEWDDTVSYEPLSVVTYEGNSYTSRQYVPIGIDIENETYWAETGNYNSQIEQYRQEVLTFDDRITQNTSDIAAIDSIIPSSNFSSENTVKDYIDTEIGELSDSVESSISDILSTLEKIAIVYDSLEEAIDNVTEEDYVIKTLSYYQNGNSGGAFYRVTQEIPEGYYETADSGVYLEIIEPDNVAQFGAKGDGITDDTTAIQNAVNNIDVVNFESNKIYRTANILVNSDNKKLIGNGCTLKTDDYQMATLTSALNIGGNKFTVDHPEYFHVNQTAMVYNETTTPTFYKVVVMEINGNELTVATYKPFRPAINSGDNSPYYFPVNSVIYSGTQIITVTSSMNAGSAIIPIKNVEISGFRFEQSLSNVRLENWFQIAYGIMFYYTEQSKFVNNYVYKASTMFLLFYGYNKDILVRNNVFDTIESAYPICSHWDMVNISNNNRAHNFNVIDNEFYECPRVVLYSSVDKGLCSNNKIEMKSARIWEMIYIYSGDVGVYPEYSQYDQESFYSNDIIVSNNTFECSVKSGIAIYFNGAKNCIATNNIIESAERNIALQASINIDINNNIINYTSTNTNDCSLCLYGSVKNIKFKNNVCNGPRIVNIYSHQKHETTEYFGYTDSTVFIENNIVRQPGRTPLVNILGETETNHTPTKLMDVPALIYLKNNTIITEQTQYVTAFSFNANLSTFITSTASLIANQMYFYQNICSASFAYSSSQFASFVNQSANIEMQRQL